MKWCTTAKVTAAVFAAALASGLAACGDKKPEGQVVAVVDGEEVTRRELAAEPAAAGLAGQAEAGPALGAILAGVVDRKLAVAEAKRLELDETADYLSQAKRAEEVLLSRTLFDRWAQQAPQPDAATIQRFIAANPQRFAGRKLLLVDRLEAGAGAADRQALAPLQTLDAVAAYLDSRDQAYRREQTVVDSASLPLALYRQLTAAAPGYPVALAQGGSLLVLAVVEARDAPAPAEQSRDLAVRALRQEAVAAKLADLRNKAKVSYQAGYRPPEQGD